MIKRSVVLCDMAEETRVQVSRSLVKCGFRIDWPMETFENLLLRCQGMPDAHLPDLVMLDITTPDGKRVDTLKKLLTRDPEAYVVVLMGPGQRAEAEKLVRRGAKDCLETPVQEIPLISLLARRNVPCHGAAEAVREVIRQEEKRRQESLDAMGEELRAAMEEVRAKSNPAERPPHIRIQAGAYGDESPADVDEEGFYLQDTADEEIGILLERMDIAERKEKEAAERRWEARQSIDPQRRETMETLLARGRQALAEKEWAQARKNFGAVVRRDDQNGTALVGLLLAEAEAADLGIFAKKRVQQVEAALRYEPLYLSGDEAFVKQLVERVCLPGYIEESHVRKACEFDLCIGTRLRSVKRHAEQEQQFWSASSPDECMAKLFSEDVEELVARAVEQARKRVAAGLAALCETVQQEEAQTRETVLNEYRARRWGTRDRTRLPCWAQRGPGPKNAIKWRKSCWKRAISGARP